MSKQVSGLPVSAKSNVNAAKANTGKTNLIYDGSSTVGVPV